MKVIARIVTRMQGENDGLIIGAVLKGHDYFKPSTVYQIVEIMGELIVQEVGDATPAKDEETVADSVVSTSWSCEIGHVISMAGPYLFMSRDEAQKAISKQWESEA